MFNTDGSLKLFAFTTPKGTFTLSGSSTDGTDTWKNINTGEFHEWKRSSIKTWWEQGKINPVEEATTVIWIETNRNTAKTGYNTKTIHTRPKK